MKYDANLTTGQLLNRGLWRTQTGHIIAIKDMTDRHLENSIKILNGKFGHIYSEYAFQMETELRKRRLQEINSTSPQINTSNEVEIIERAIQYHCDQIFELQKKLAHLTSPT